MFHLEIHGFTFLVSLQGMIKFQILGMEVTYFNHHKDFGSIVTFQQSFSFHFIYSSFVILLYPGRPKTDIVEKINVSTFFFPDDASCSPLHTDICLRAKG